MSIPIPPLAWWFFVALVLCCAFLLPVIPDRDGLLQYEASWRY